MNQFKIFLTVLVTFIGLQSFATSDAAQVIQGKWVAKRYLPYGIENGKVVAIPNPTLKPEHFGLFLYSAKQTIEIVIPEAKDSNTEKIPGSIQSDQSLLDLGCLKSSVYKTYSGCTSAPNQKLDLSFRFFEIGGNSRSAEGTMMAAWAKSGLTEIKSGFTATATDYTSHLGFFGQKHLLLRVNYFKNALKNSEDAFASKCPKRNKCYVMFLQFDRVTE